MKKLKRQSKCLMAKISKAEILLSMKQDQWKTDHEEQVVADTAVGRVVADTAVEQEGEEDMDEETNKQYTKALTKRHMRNQKQYHDWYCF